MSGFEDFSRQASQLEHEIARWGLVLNIDWDNAAQVAALARAAIAFKPGDQGLPHEPGERARFELFGLAQLMLTVMAESADAGMHTHGGPAWKSFARALYQAAGTSAQTR